MCIIGALVAGGMSVAAAWATTISTAVSLVGIAVSTTMGAVNAAQQGKAQQQQYEYQAAVNRKNAKIAQANADQKRQEGIEEARMQRIKNLQRIGQQKTAMAANGVDTASGTALDIIEDTAAMGELDALTTSYNAETNAQAFEHQASNFNNQANLDSLAGQNAYKAGMLNAVGQGFEGLGKMGEVASNWYAPNSIGSETKKTKAVKVSGGISGDNITFA